MPTVVELFANIALTVCPAGAKTCPAPAYPLPVGNVAVTLKEKDKDHWAGTELLELAKEGVTFSCRLDVEKNRRAGRWEYLVKATLSDSGGGSSYPSLEAEVPDVGARWSATLHGLTIPRHEMLLTPHLVLGPKI